MADGIAFVWLQHELPWVGHGFIHRLLDELGRQGQLDWSRASLDSLSVRAKRGAS